MEIIGQSLGIIGSILYYGSFIFMIIILSTIGFLIGNITTKVIFSKTKLYKKKPFDPNNIKPTKEEKKDPWFLINNLKH